MDEGEGGHPMVNESEELFPSEGLPDKVAPEGKEEKLTKFPVGRIKNLMKLDPDVHAASQEAVFLITKALELFVDNMAKEAHLYTAQKKKKTVVKTDVDQAIDAADCLAFLEGALDD